MLILVSLCHGRGAKRGGLLKLVHSCPPAARQLLHLPELEGLHLDHVGGVAFLQLIPAPSCLLLSNGDHLCRSSLGLLVLSPPLALVPVLLEGAVVVLHLLPGQAVPGLQVQQGGAGPVLHDERHRRVGEHLGKLGLAVGLLPPLLGHLVMVLRTTVHPRNRALVGMRDAGVCNPFKRLQPRPADRRRGTSGPPQRLLSRHGSHHRFFSLIFARRLVHGGLHGSWLHGTGSTDHWRGPSATRPSGLLWSSLLS
mmetsp:Transcript_15564/g.43542  ORF Transcript_15564/g.43542 Transcript_15564/m.43542 type:complete len:253 (-) Transcript_15564:341-1099(-)